MTGLSDHDGRNAQLGGALLDRCVRAEFAAVVGSVLTACVSRDSALRHDAYRLLDSADVIDRGWRNSSHARAAVPSLARALDDDDPGMSASALDVLRKIDSAEASRTVASHKRKQEASADAERLARNAAGGRHIVEVAAMSDDEIVGTLSALCDAYVANDRSRVSDLEVVASAVGTLLDRRGGILEMRRVLGRLGSRRGARTLEMHWGGIGSWRGQDCRTLNFSAPPAHVNLSASGDDGIRVVAQCDAYVSPSTRTPVALSDRWDTALHLTRAALRKAVRVAA